MQGIEEKVMDLIEKLFAIDKDALCKKKNVFLTGREFQLDQLDMLVLMLNLEKYFKIKFNKDDLLNYGLATVGNITLTVLRKLD